MGSLQPTGRHAVNCLLRGVAMAWLVLDFYRLILRPGDLHYKPVVVVYNMLNSRRLKLLAGMPTALPVGNMGSHVCIYSL